MCRINFTACKLGGIHSWNAGKHSIFWQHFGKHSTDNWNLKKKEKKLRAGNDYVRHLFLAYTFSNNILAIASWIFGIHKKSIIFWNINLRAGNGCFRHQMLQNCAFWSTDTTAKHQFEQKQFYRFLTVESLLCLQKNRKNTKNTIFWRILTLF